MNLIYSIVLIFLSLTSNFNCSKIIRNLDDYTLTFDSSKWNYDSTNGVYYQIGVYYCTKPVSTTHQSLGIYVPKEYMTCTEASGTYSCSINTSGTKGSYTATNAPLVMPVNTSGYSAMKAPTSYSYNTVSSFIEKGIIYIYAGCRGRYEGGESYIAGAPWGVTDLKAAIRFIRYNSASIPGDLNRIYTFGHSGGGAQSCLMGVTGNSELFKEYLEEIGAAMNDANGNEIKDNIKGSQCWCPITNLDIADAAYEWNMGQYSSSGTRASGTFTKSLSDDLTAKYVEYVNSIKLKDPEGNELTLTGTNEGTYYNYLKSVIEESLNNFLADTSFPYTPSSSSNGGQQGGDPPSGDPPSKVSKRQLETYNTVSDYIDSLNSDSQWVTYDSSTNKATITNVGDFVTHCKSPSKNVGAFDDLSKSQAENKLFGIDGTTYTKHFDRIMAGLLTDKSSSYSSLTNWDSSYPNDYTNDLSVQDSLGKTIETRVNMYNPMYYLNSYYDGYQKSDVANYFRINTGITQGDTSNVVEMNLYLALLNYGKNANFTTVWEQGHTEAERTGDAEDNFISWIAQIEENNSNSNSTNTTISTNPTSTTISTNPTSTTISTNPTSTTISTNPTSATISTNPTSSTIPTNPTNSSDDGDDISSDNPIKISIYSGILKFNYFIFLLFVLVIM